MMTLISPRSMAVGLFFGVVAAPHAREQSIPVPLDARTKFVLTNTRAILMTYRGRAALHLAPLPGHEHDTDQEMIALLPKLTLPTARSTSTWSELAARATPPTT